LLVEGTEFQEKVWKELENIPYGETRTYAQIAEAVGKPKAVRAVGAANNRNTLPIFIPCHRVVGSNGSLTGYSGGLEAKRKLLEIEAKGSGR
jgi:methylated-DNA-[protein]-cysteine S-methyltransferase